MMTTRKKSAMWLLALSAGCLLACTQSTSAQDITDPVYGKLKLIDSVDLTKEKPGHEFVGIPKNLTKVETVLGKKCRVLPNQFSEPMAFGVRLGRGKGLQAGKYYLLTVDYPQDKSRTINIVNRGCDTNRGFHTGHAVGDALKGRYVNNNCESINFPLSGKYETWRQFFALNDRFIDQHNPRHDKSRNSVPKDGFMVFIAQMPKELGPFSAGAALRSIKLYEVVNPKTAHVKLNLPPEGLPKRHIFWREEMSDGIYNLNAKTPDMRGINDPVRWYRDKVAQMKTLGIDTLSKDLLEFGHNQGWDSGKYGSNAWINQTKDPKMWSRVVTMLGKENVNILPYYEYKGSIGQDTTKSLGRQRRARRLDSDGDYTHVSWLEKHNCDITDPDTLADVKKILEITIADEKEKANFLGAWFRSRPSHNPISFNDKNLVMFAKEANNNQAVTRKNLQDDAVLLDRYYAWWFGKRRQYLQGIRDYLKTNVSSSAFVLYTTDASEPGRSIPSHIAGKGQKNPWTYRTSIVTDNVDLFNSTIDRSYADKHGIKAVSLDRAINEDMHFAAITSWAGNWGKWDWKHSVPKPDPENYKDVDDVFMSMTFNRLYTVSSAKPFDAFRTKSGLAVVRHYTLNENEMGPNDKSPVGYYVCDVEAAGPYCMASEVRAMANGDPSLLGYLIGNNYNRGFPEYVRSFNTAFLALPALPSKIVKGACSDPEVVVREIKTKGNGTYYSVSHIGFKPKQGVSIKLPATGHVTNAATGKSVAQKNSVIKLDFHPCQLTALHVK